MFLILNNETCYKKQILKIPDPDQLHDGGCAAAASKKSHFTNIGVQGFTDGKIYENNNTTIIICGEIKNANKLAQKMFLSGGGGAPTAPTTPTANIGDILGRILFILYKNYGFEYMMQQLEGEFTIVVLDCNLNNPKSNLYIAQDRLGLYPLYYCGPGATPGGGGEGPDIYRKLIAFSNSAKQLCELMSGVSAVPAVCIRPFVPGTYSHFECVFKVLSYWVPSLRCGQIPKLNIPYAVSWPKNSLYVKSKGELRNECLKYTNIIRNALMDSINLDLAHIRERAHNPPQNPPDVYKLPHLNRTQKMPSKYDYEKCNCEVGFPKPKPKMTPIGCLLSGGLDSSLIFSVLRNNLKMQNYNPDEFVYTFTMGFEGSMDHTCAKDVVNHIGGLAAENHTDYVINEDIYMSVIPTVIKLLETRDIATIRYGCALYLLLSFIRDTTNIRDIFTGDGADESTGGYLNFYYMKNAIEHDYECNQILNMYYKSGALYRKLFAHFGMRWYKPFLNDVWLSQYMSIPMELRFDIELNRNPHIKKGAQGTGGAAAPPAAEAGDINNLFDICIKSLRKQTAEVAPFKPQVSRTNDIFHNNKYLKKCNYVGIGVEKMLLRISFSEEYFKNMNFMELLPGHILWRTSEPGYDSISSFGRPLCKIIRDHLGKQSSDKDGLIPEDGGEDGGADSPEISDMSEISDWGSSEEEPIRETEHYNKIYDYMGLCFLGVITDTNRCPPYKYATTMYEPTMRNLDIYLDLHIDYQDRTL